MRAGRYLEVLVGQLEHLLGVGTLTVRSPEFIPNRHTGDPVEVDVTLRGRVGSTDVLVALECRDRGKREGVNWIRELATKRDDIGAAAIVAVSRSGFTKDATAEAASRGVVLKTLLRLSEKEIAEAVLGLRVDVLRARYLVTAIAQVSYRGFFIDLRDPSPKLTIEDLRDLAAHPSELRLFDEKERKPVSFQDLLGMADWELAFRIAGEGSPHTAEVRVPCNFVDEYGREAERYRWFLGRDCGILFSTLTLVADVWYEREPAELSAVFEYSEESRCIARVAEIDLTPLGRPQDVLQVFLISPTAD